MSNACTPCPTPQPAPPKAEAAPAAKAEKQRDPISDTDLDTLQQLLQRSKSAQEAYSRFTQEQVDRIFKAVRWPGRGAAPGLALQGGGGWTVARRRWCG